MTADRPHLLLLDDDADVLKEVALFLERQFQVVGVSSLEEGMAELDRHEPGFGVVVSDMQLPERPQGGLQFVQAIATRPNPPLSIVLTGFGDIENASQCMQAGAFGYVEKGKENTFQRLERLCLRAHHRWLLSGSSGLPPLLVLDDDAGVSQEVALCLGPMFQVERVSALQEAIDKLSDPAANYAVVVTDMRLPGETRAGLQLAQQVRAIPRRPEVVVLTGHPFLEDASDGMQLGVFGYVEKGKPTTFDRLEECCFKAHRKWLANVQQTRAASAGTSGDVQKSSATRHVVAVAEADASPTRKPEIFVSYSHEDTRYRVEFERQMAVLRKYGTISIWSDAEIKPSYVWRREIEAALNRATLGVILVSKNYVNSDFCTDVELQRFVEAQATRGLRLVAIIIADCYWEKIPHIGKFQVLPKDRNNHIKPIKSFKDKDSAWASVVRQIDELL